ncbi:hypothetical protein WA026_017176 [Henosepilachna vigintioctopunctata]|uniref:Ionotropic receptor n=1 Tax=Henosepilachna vigintioctopunctata TaxID=420089 RepID=A0AAW1UF68_9CUCU
MSFCKEILVTFFLLLQTINLNAIQRNNDPNDQFIIPLIVHIMNEHKNDKTGVTFISTTSMDEHIDIIFKSVKNNFLTNGMYFFKGKSFEKVPQTSVYIVLSNSKYGLLHNLFTENTKSQKILKVRSTIFLVFMDYPKVDFLKEILKNLWDKNYIYVLGTYVDERKLYFLSYTAYNASYQQIDFNKYHTGIFEGKTSNFYKNPINVLFTFNDHTKIRKVRDYEGINQKYEGKDYDIIKAIFENLNANLTVIDIDDTISDTINNPWFTNLDMENKSDEQADILKKWNITMLTKSQRDLENDGVIEVTYPHTDNAITLLVPKRQKISKPVEVYNYLMQPVWLIHLFIFTVLVICLSIMRIMSSKSCELEPANQLFRIMITCSSNGLWRKPFEELFILAWIIWCFLVSIMAQAKITSMLSTDLYESELDSLEDIYRKPKLDFIIFGLNSYIDELSEKYEGSKYMRIITGNIIIIQM